MKKLVFIFLIAISSFTVFCQTENTCDRFFPTNLTYHDDFLDIHYDNVSTGSEYRIFHRTNEYVNTDLNVIDIKKPIIVIEGYDVFYDFYCEDIYDAYINALGLGDDLRNDGYDIITYNNDTPWGALQPNAMVFANFIKYINENKKGNEELVIIGVSQGGLLARYALTYLEENNLQHQTRLFISFDSPHKGATVPLSLQAMIVRGYVPLLAFFDAILYEGELFRLWASFGGNGTQQMINRNILNLSNGVANPSDKFTVFFDELTAMNSCDGFPLECKCVGISNGSLNGGRQEGRTTIGNNSGNIAIQIDYGGTTPPYYHRKLYTSPGTDNPLPGGGTCIIERWSECDMEYDDIEYFISDDNRPYDHVPGGNYPWFKRVNDELSSFSEVTISNYNNDRTCFVSTNSALALNTNDEMLNLSSYGKSQVLNDSYFDDIWWDTGHNNMGHTFLYDFPMADYYSLSDFMYEQITNQNDFYASKENWSTYLGQTVQGEKDLFKAVNSFTIGNYTIKNGGLLTIKSGNSVSINTNFEVEVGGEFSVMIENIDERDCSLSGNLPNYNP